MDRIIDTQLEDLKKLTLEMGGLVEKALSTTTNGLLKRELNSLKQVHTIEESINSLQIKNKRICFFVYL